MTADPTPASTPQNAPSGPLGAPQPENTAQGHTAPADAPHAHTAAHDRDETFPDPCDRDDRPDLGDIAAAEEYGRRIRATPPAEVGEHIRDLIQSGTMPIRRVQLDDDPDPDVFRRRIADAARTVRLRLGPNALAMVQRGEPIPLNLGEADQVADAVLAVVQPCLDRLVDYAAEMEQRVIDLGQHREVAERARAEVDRLTALVGRYAGRAVANGQRAEQTEAALARVRAAVAERRAEVAEYEAEHPPSAWSDAVTVTCDRIDDALRPEVEPQDIPAADGPPAGPPA